VKTGVRIVIEDGAAKLADRSSLAGSVATCDRLVRVMIKAGVPLFDAVKMATETPAKVMNNTHVGLIKAGLAADLIVFDENIKVLRVLLASKSVYKA
jgi:N-acetylglucosamine-6-phosphate deacetylase